MEPERRAEDPRVNQLISDVAAIKEAVALSTEITTEIRNIVAGFKTMAKIAKWLTAMVALAVSLIALAKGIVTFNDIPK